MNDMTFEEFKEAFDKGIGYSFEQFGFEGILNILCLCERYSAKEDKEKGFNASAEMSTQNADMWYNLLKERGFYND